LGTSLQRPIAHGDEGETEEFDEEAGEDESDALTETGEQEERGGDQQPAGDH